MTAYYPDPTPEPQAHASRLYDCTADVYVAGTLIVAAGDVFSEDVRRQVDTLKNGRGHHYYRIHERPIPFQGEAIPFDDEPIREWQPSDATMRYMREEVWR